MESLKQASIEAALVELIEALDGADEASWPAVRRAVDHAIQVLGFDPTVKESYYNVSLEIPVYARSAKEAVNEYAKMVSENPLTDWVYTVEDTEAGDTIWIDGFEIEEGF